MMFLERDVWQMKQRIGGSPSFFRNRIRKALRESAKVERTVINLVAIKLPLMK